MSNSETIRQNVFKSGFSFDDIINLESYIRKETAIFWADEDHFREALSREPQLKWHDQHLIVLPLLQLKEEHSKTVEYSLSLMGQMFLDSSTDFVTPIGLFGTALSLFIQLEPTCSEKVANPESWIQDLTRLSGTFLDLSFKQAEDKPFSQHERIRFAKDWNFFVKNQSELSH